MRKPPGPGPLGRRWRSGAASLVLLLLISTSGDATEMMLDGIAAQVGSDIVLISEVRNLVAPMEARLEQMGASEAEYAAVRADALERLIERALLQQVIRRAELGATDIEVDGAIASIASENDLSVSQLVAAVEAQGLPFDVYRDRIRAELEQTKVINSMVASKVRVEEDEIRERYDSEMGDQPTGGTEAHLRHLIIPFIPDAPAATKTVACGRMREAHRRLMEGESFELLHSELAEGDPSRGGDMGWIHESTMASWMSPVRSIGPGEYTDVIEAPFGCNVLQVVARREFQPMSYEEAKLRIKERLFHERMQVEYVAFMEKLRDRTYIERKGVFADAARLTETGFNEGP